MPWEHCGIAFILDNEACPKCGIGKAAWTVQIDQTRTFVVGGPTKKSANWIELELLDAEGAPLGDQPYELKLANDRALTGELDEAGVARLKRLFPGPVQVVFPGISLRSARWRQSAGPPVPLPEGDGQAKSGEGRAPTKLSFKRKEALKNGNAGYLLKHPYGKRLAEQKGEPPPEEKTAEGWRPWKDELELSRAQLQAGGQQRYTFRLAPPGVKIDLPLTVSHRNLAEAQRSILSHPIEVQLDGERVAAGSFAESAKRVVVQFQAPPGEHTLLVYSRAQARADGKRRRPLIYANRTITVSRSQA